LSRLSTTCCAVRAVTPLMADGTSRLIYFSYVQSIIPYGLISGGNSLQSNNIFKIKK